MPFPSSISAEQLPAGPRVTNGDVEQFAFSRITRLRGTTGTTLANAPALTLTGNLLTVAAPVRNWSMVPFAGLGLSLEVAYAAGNFPEVAIREVQQFLTASTSHVYNYPLARVVNQLLVVVVATAALTTITTPAGWTLVSSQAGTESRSSVFFRILTGAEGDTETITFGTASGAIMRTWCINLADGDVETTDALNDSAAGTSLDIGSVAPTWAINEATNTLYIAVCATADDVSFSAFPSAYTPSGQTANTSGTANIDCALAFAERRTLGSSEDPSAFTYAASRSTGHIIAIQPKPAGRINWDGLEVRDNTTPVGTQRAVNLIEGSGISLVFNNNVGTGAVDVTINATGGGGAGWDDVLATDNHSGANNPFVDTGQFLTFGTGTPTQTTGDIRADSDLFIHPDVGFELQAHDTIYIHGPDTILLESTGGSPVRLLSSTTVELESTAGPVELNANTFVDVTNGFIRMQEQTASTPVLGAGKGLFWVRDDVPCIPMFTDDTNVDFKLLKQFALVSDLQIIATNTILGRVTAGTGVIEVLTGTQATTILDVFTSSLKGLVPASGGGTTNFLRADGTFATPLANNSVTNAIAADMPALTVKANATNATADPQDVASSADDTVFRRTSTTLNWGQLTVGMAPNDLWTYAKIQNVSATSRFLGRITAAAGDIEELTGTQATTLLDNFTSTLKGLVPGSGGGTTNFLRADGTWAVPVDTNTGHVIRDDGVGMTQRAALNFVSGAGAGNINFVLADDAGGNETEVTGTLATQAALSVLANATNATAAPTALAAGADDRILRRTSSTLNFGQLTAGMFTANLVTNALSAQMAANTIKANATAATADAQDVSIAAESVVGRTSGNLQAITSAAQSILMRAAGSVFWGAAAADQVLRRSGSGDLGFGTLVTANIGDGQITLAKLANLAAGTVIGRQIDAGTGVPVALTGLELGENLRMSTAQTHSQTGASQTITLNADANILVKTGGVSVNIIGITGGDSGRMLMLRHTSGGGSTTTIEHDVGAVAADGILTPGGVPFVFGGASGGVNAIAAILIYQSGSARWVLFPRGHSLAEDIAWTGTHTFTQSGSFTVASTLDIRLNATDGLGLCAGFTLSDVATGDVMINASSGIGIFAGFVSAESAMSADDISIGADSGVAITAGITAITNVSAGILLSTLTTITLTTNSVERLHVQADGAWRVNGVDGEPGKVITSAGAAASPDWDYVASPRNCKWWEDFEFFTPSTLSAITFCGNSNWYVFKAGSAGGSTQFIAGEANHPGIIRLETHTVIDNLMCIHRGRDTTALPTHAWVRGDQILESTTIMRLVADTTVGFFIGFSEDPSSLAITGTGNSNIIGFFFDTAGAFVDTTIHCITREADGTATNTDTAIAPGTGFRKYGIRQNTLGTIEFLIDGSVVATHSTQVPDTEGMNFGITVITRLAAVARSVDIDYVDFTSQPLTR